MSDLRKSIEALKRYQMVEKAWGESHMEENPAGAYLDRMEVLALLPAEAPPPAVCPACKRTVAKNTAQGATTFCVDPWHE